MLLEQKFFEFLKTENVAGSLRTLRDEMEPLGVNKKRIHELASQVISASVEDAESVRFVERLQSLFPPAVSISWRITLILSGDTVFTIMLWIVICLSSPNINVGNVKYRPRLYRY